MKHNQSQHYSTLKLKTSIISKLMPKPEIINKSSKDLIDILIMSLMKMIVIIMVGISFREIWSKYRLSQILRLIIMEIWRIWAIGTSISSSNHLFSHPLQNIMNSIINIIKTIMYITGILAATCKVWDLVQMQIIMKSILTSLKNMVKN